MLACIFRTSSDTTASRICCGMLCSNSALPFFSSRNSSSLAAAALQLPGPSGSSQTSEASRPAACASFVICSISSVLSLAAHLNNDRRSRICSWTLSRCFASSSTSGPSNEYTFTLARSASISRALWELLQSSSCLASLACCASRSRARAYLSTSGSDSCSCIARSRSPSIACNASSTSPALCTLLFSAPSINAVCSLSNLLTSTDSFRCVRIAVRARPPLHADCIFTAGVVRWLRSASSSILWNSSDMKTVVVVTTASVSLTRSTPPATLCRWAIKLRAAALRSVSLVARSPQVDPALRKMSARCSAGTRTA
mmetsp:Transcript_38096/g.70836  ORF Transcript_38096/g.70836 Transcript_38096/m.70836 type:complete len:313 (+) Transcript_38096:977-1915(+)